MGPIRIELVGIDPDSLIQSDQMRIILLSPPYNVRYMLVLAFYLLQHETGTSLILYNNHTYLPRWAVETAVLNYDNLGTEIAV